MPAFFWSVMGGNLQVIRLCLKAGFDPFELDETGQNALFYVPNTPEGALVWEELLALGLNPNQPSHNGSVAWSKMPQSLKEEVEDPQDNNYNHLRKTPRPTLGPTRRTIDEDED